jgi:hypothetical protein
MTNLTSFIQFYSIYGAFYKYTDANIFTTNWQIIQDQG